MVTNTFEPITIFKGQNTLVKVPDDLFTDFDDNKLTYQTVLADSNKLGQLVTSISNKENSEELFLLFLADKVETYNLAIIASDPYNQTAEVVIRVQVIDCSSKAA